MYKMSGVNNSLPWTESGALAEVLTADSCHIVLETAPPKYVEKVSRYLESTYGQNGQDEVSKGPPEADSDSGDSLFITQKPVPQPVRSRRSRYNQSADPSPRPRDLSESGDDSSSSSSSDEAVSKTCYRKKWSFKLPEYRFLFLTEKKCKPQSKMIQMQQNTSLHNFSMGGFLKCAQKRWEACQRGDDVESSLPTVDTDGESISPLTEEEEGSENEDIKVVDRKLFAVPIKTKGQQQAWCCQLTQTKRRKDTNGKRETVKTTRKVSNQPTTSMITPESAEAEKKKEASVDKLRSNREMYSLQKSPQHHNKRDTESSTATTEPQTDVLQEQNLPQTAQAATSKTNTDILSNESTAKKRKNKKKDKGDHAAASVNIEMVGSPKSRNENRAEPLVAQTSNELEFNGEHLFEKPLFNDNGLEHVQTDSQDAEKKKKKKKMCKNDADNVTSLDLREEDSVSENSRKKKKKRRSNEDVVEQIQPADVPELLSDAFKRQRKKKKRKREERNTISEEEKGLSPPKETLESSFVERTTHKKKRKSSSNDKNQEGEEDLYMNSVNDNAALSESTETAMKKREKKKKKTLVEGVDNSYNAEEVEKVANEDEVQEAVGGLQDENAEAVIRKKKKKRKKTSEDNTGQNDDSVSAKEKSTSFLAESLSFVAPAAKLNISAANLEAESEEITGNVDELGKKDRKKKKKRKRKISEGESDAEKNNKADFQVPDSTCLVREEHTRHETEVMTQLESLESAEDAGFFSTDEAVMLKRKKKKKKGKDETCHAIQESPLGATEEAGSVDKQAETSSDRIMKEKRMKIKKRLYSPSDDFLTDV